MNLKITTSRCVRPPIARIRRMLAVTLLALIAGSPGLATADHGEAGINELVVFGDSLSDTGNVYLATAGLAPASPQWFNGRFTNGLVWHEVLAAGMGVGPAAPSLMGGKNYAWGGAEYGPGFAAGLGVPNVGTQILQFLSANTPAADQLFVIQAGNNDFIPPGEPADPDLLAQQVVEHVSTLAAAGARHFLVPTSDIRAGTPGLNPPLDQALFFGNPSPAAVADVLERRKRFNQLLRRSLVQLERQLNRDFGNVTISFLNLDLAGKVIIKQPALFSIEEVTTPALTSFFDPLCFCEGSVAGNAEQFFFFDIVHPTATVHAVYGELARLNVSLKLRRSLRAAAEQD